MNASMKAVFPGAVASRPRLSKSERVEFHAHDRAERARRVEAMERRRREVLAQFGAKKIGCRLDARLGRTRLSLFDEDAVVKAARIA